MLKGRRGPVVVGAVAVVLALVMVFLLVLPKMNQVNDAQDTLDTTKSQNAGLQSELAALRQAQAEAPKNKAIISDVATQIPPTADLPGLVLLLENAASRAGIILSTMTPSTPVFDPSTGLSAITVSYTVSGTYFALTEYLYNLETLPRAAKTTDVTLGVSSTDAAATTAATIPTLSMTGSVVLYTTDASAGPGSVPGPTAPEGAVASTPTTTSSPTAAPVT
jgi:Tfp pilus assembly protein PilO